MSDYEAVVNHPNDEFAVIRLSDHRSKSEVKITAFGCNLVQYVSKGQNWIMGPPSFADLRQAPTKFGVPILWPPNRVRHATFTYANRQYHLPKNYGSHHIHGELCTHVWDIVDYGAEQDVGAFVTLRLSLDEHLDIYKYYPHSVTLEITYTLRNGEILAAGVVTNNGPSDAPFGLGFHPYFCLEPFKENDKPVRVTVPVSTEWNVDQDGFVIGSPVETPICGELRDACSLSTVGLNGNYRLFSLAKNDMNDCRLIADDSRSHVSLQLSELFSELALFRPTWGNAISLEPYTCSTDAFNSDLPSETTHLRRLESQTSEAFWWRIGVKFDKKQ